MELVLDLLQGAGIAAAIGIRPLLPVLLVGALAAGDAGIDFGGTDFSFLESGAFLIGIVALVAVFDIVRRRAGEEALEAGAGLFALAALCVVLGALEAAGSLADRDHPVVVGLLAGAVCAALGVFASRPLFSRVRGRLEASAAGMLSLYREAAALLAAGLSVLFPPLALVVIGVLVWLLAGSRRRSGEKYAGLRILR